MGYEDLEVWKRSANLSVEIYRELSGLKDFGFKDQITRSGLSIPSNIAVGYERNGVKERFNFLNYAKGSAGELRTQIFIGIKVGFIKEKVGCRWLDEVKVISKMLFSLMKRYDKK